MSREVHICKMLVTVEPEITLGHSCFSHTFHSQRDVFDDVTCILEFSQTGTIGVSDTFGIIHVLF